RRAVAIIGWGVSQDCYSSLVKTTKKPTQRRRLGAQDLRLVKARAEVKAYVRQGRATGSATDRPQRPAARALLSRFSGFDTGQTSCPYPFKVLTRLSRR